MIVDILTSGMYVEIQKNALGKNALGIRREIYSVMPDHKEASTRIKQHPKATSDVGYGRFCICCKNTKVSVYYSGTPIESHF